MTRILVFDSGVGGLSVAAEISALLPTAELAYLADNDFFPYGTKPEAVLIERVDRVVSEAVARLAPDAVVIACNTASTVVLPQLRAHLACPVVGVVPAVKPAAARSRNRIIGLLGTPGTVRRRYTEDLIQRFAADCTVHRVGSAELVEMAERALEGEAVPIAAIRSVLAPFFDLPPEARPDTIVLACTHFPLLRTAMLEAAPPGTEFIDSGRAVAERVRHVIGDAATAGEPVNTALFTRDEPSLRRRLPAFVARGFPDVGFLSIG
ncbi:MAG TPA: glutamate racemase [Aliidongia sp.]|nr:glutamate racemase [Aliidongia sp.]